MTYARIFREDVDHLGLLSMLIMPFIVDRVHTVDVGGWAVFETRIHSVQTGIQAWNITHNRRIRTAPEGGFTDGAGLNICVTGRMGWWNLVGLGKMVHFEAVNLRILLKRNRRIKMLLSAGNYRVAACISPDLAQPSRLVTHRLLRMVRDLVGK